MSISDVNNTNNNITNQSTFNVMENTSNNYNLNDLKKEIKSEKSSQKEKSTINYSKKKIIIIASIIIILIIVGLILIIGHIAFGWFKKKKELVVEQKRQENNVSRYLETKNATNIYNYDGINDTQNIVNNTILTDFIVALNKKTKIDKRYDLSDIDYIYETFLLIINITLLNETDSLFLGGLNIYNESKTIQDLIEINQNLFPNNSYESINLTNKTQNNIPFCKFYFYENGTLDNIYFPINVNDFYKSAIEDLIEKVTPKLSKSLYKNETNKRRLDNREEGIYFNYEQILKNGALDKTIIYEDKIKKNFGKNKDEYIFENNEINSKIVRIFNPSGDITSIKMEGEASFISAQSKNNNKGKNNNLRLIEEVNEKKIDTNESYYSLYLNEFKINVTSNMTLIKTSYEPEILEKLNYLSEIINLELYKDLNDSNSNTEKGNETDEKTLNESLIELNDSNYINNISELNDSTIQLRNLAANDINFCSSYSSKYRILSVNFLGLYVGLNQHMYINNRTGLRQNYVNLIIGSRESTISTINMYQYYYSGSKSITKKVVDTKFGLNKKFQPFGFLIDAGLNIKSNLNHGISIDIINKEMYTKGFTNFELGVEGSFGPNFIFFSFGASLTGYIAKGNSYIQANTLLKVHSKLTKFSFYKYLNSCSVDLEFYFSIWLIFWEKKFSTSFNLFKGISSYDYFYDYY